MVEFENIDNSKDAWYVMRVTYQRELYASKILDELNIKNFVPTQRTKIRNSQGISIGWRTEPLVHNYIFIFSNFNKIMELKQGRLDFLRFLMMKNKGDNAIPQTVREKEMLNFIKIVNTNKAVLLDASIDLKKGEKVRVLTGVFEGVEGTLVTMPNKRTKRVVVKIDGVAAVATVLLNNSDVERII